MWQIEKIVSESRRHDALSPPYQVESIQEILKENIPEEIVQPTFTRTARAPLMLTNMLSAKEVLEHWERFDTLKLVVPRRSGKTTLIAKTILALPAGSHALVFGNSQSTLKVLADTIMELPLYPDIKRVRTQFGGRIKIEILRETLARVTVTLKGLWGPEARGITADYVFIEEGQELTDEDWKVVMPIIRGDLTRRPKALEVRTSSEIKHLT